MENSSIKVSIITVCFNSEKYIKQTIESVLSQSYLNIEYIIIDGGSTDNTLNIIKHYKDEIDVFVSEPDKGIYDAMNKGIKKATGDLIGILNSDDFFSSNTVIEQISANFSSLKTDIIYGDIKFIKLSQEQTKIGRYYSGKKFNIKMFRYGMMPPHSSVYIKRQLFLELGAYKPYYKIAGDFELLLRYMLINGVSYSYINLDVVTMRTGGVSTNSLQNKILLNKETLLACRENGVNSNWFLLFLKYIFKFIQLTLSTRKKK